MNKMNTSAIVSNLTGETKLQPSINKFLSSKASIPLKKQENKSGITSINFNKDTTVKSDINTQIATKTGQFDDPLGHVDTNMIDDSIKIIQEDDKQSEGKTRKRNADKKKNSTVDDDDDPDIDVDLDQEIDDGIDDEIENLLNDTQKTNKKPKKSPKNIDPRKIILKEEQGNTLTQPKQPKDVQLSPDIDFGVDKIANKDVLGIISGDEQDSDGQRGKKLFQSDKKSRHKNEGVSKKTASLDLNKGAMKTKLTLKNNPNVKELPENDDDDDEENLEDFDVDDEDLVGSGDPSVSKDNTNGDEDDVDEEDVDEEDVDEDDLDEEDVDEGDGENGEDGDNVPEIDENEEDNKSSEKETNEINNEENRSSLLNIGAEDEEQLKKKDRRKLTRHELNVLKRKELTLLERLERKGFKACKKFTMVDKLDDIIAERERLDDEKGCEESIKWQRKIIMGASTGIEYLNKVYDPFDLKLEGWSESIYENISDYDEVFEELYHKYKNKVKVAPEIKLIGMFAGSALMFHFSKTLFSKASDQVPGFDDVMRDNPDIKAAYEQAALKKMNMNNNQSNSPIGSMIGNFFGNPMLGNMVGGLVNNQQTSMRPQPQPQMQSPMRQQPQTSMHPQPQTSIRPQPSHQSQPTSTLNGNTIIPKTSGSHIPSTNHAETNNIEIDGPSGVDDLLKSLTKGTNADLTELQLSDIDTTGTISDIGSNIKTVNFHNKRATKNNNRGKKLNLKLQ